MKDQAFSFAMRRIIGEAEAGSHREFVFRMPAQQRTHVSGRVRSLFAVLFLAAVSYIAYTHRAELAALF